MSRKNKGKQKQPSKRGHDESKAIRYKVKWIRVDKHGNELEGLKPNSPQFKASKLQRAMEQENLAKPPSAYLEPEPEIPDNVIPSSTFEERRKALASKGKIKSVEDHQKFFGKPFTKTDRHPTYRGRLWQSEKKLQEEVEFLKSCADLSRSGKRYMGNFDIVRLDTDERGKETIRYVGICAEQAFYTVRMCDVKATHIHASKGFVQDLMIDSKPVVQTTVGKVIKGGIAFENKKGTVQSPLSEAVNKQVEFVQWLINNVEREKWPPYVDQKNYVTTSSRGNLRVNIAMIENDEFLKVNINSNTGMLEQALASLSKAYIDMREQMLEHKHRADWAEIELGYQGRYFDPDDVVQTTSVPPPPLSYLDKKLQQFQFWQNTQGTRFAYLRTVEPEHYLQLNDDLAWYIKNKADCRTKAAKERWRLRVIGMRTRWTLRGSYKKLSIHDLASNDTPVARYKATLAAKERAQKILDYVPTKRRINIVVGCKDIQLSNQRLCSSDFYTPVPRFVDTEWWHSNARYERHAIRYEQFWRNNIDRLEKDYLLTTNRGKVVLGAIKAWNSFADVMNTELNPFTRQRIHAEKMERERIKAERLKRKDEVKENKVIKRTEADMRQHIRKMYSIAH